MKPKEGWLKGDLSTKRVMLVHAITDPNGGVHTLDLSREGEVDHLGVWRIQAVADVVSISFYPLPCANGQSGLSQLRVFLI